MSRKTVVRASLCARIPVEQFVSKRAEEALTQHDAQNVADRAVGLSDARIPVAVAINHGRVLGAMSAMVDDVHWLASGEYHAENFKHNAGL